MKRGFTLIELMLAVSLLGVMTVVTILTFRAVTSGWRISREYCDRLERTDYAVDQLVSGLKCAYYPHSGEQSYDYGFQLIDNGDGENPRESDVIEWTKKGSAMVGGSSAADSVHRIQVMILEEGDRTWGEEIEKTGLYARVRPMSKVIAQQSGHFDEEDFTFESDELYRPILIAKDVEGFNCRVLPKEPDSTGKNAQIDKSDWEDEFSESNSLPYKIQLTMYLPKEDPEYRSRKTIIPIMRVVNMPIYEQSTDAAALPGNESEAKGEKKQ